jgi:hypothetical protein
MAITGDLVDGALDAATNSIRSIIQHFNNGTLDDALLLTLTDAWKELDQTADPVTQAIAEGILDFLDGLSGIPEAAASGISGALSGLAEALLRALGTPICVDLDNDQLEYLPNTATSGVFFDIDADGFAEKTEWLAPDDGFLVRDLNGSGTIDSQAEMFGDNGGTSAYAKLAALNTNNTGASANAITSADAVWSTLKLLPIINNKANIIFLLRGAA